MCGIGGILRVHPPGSEVPPPELSIPEAWLDILDDSIKHRGPDGQGRFRDRVIRPDGSVVDVALVHRRLSILDHAGGAQPMVSLGRSAPLRTSVPGTSALRADPTHPSSSSTSTSASHTPSDPTTTAHGSSSVGSESRPTYRGLPLPVLFHGQPKDEVRYRTMVERGNGNGSGHLVLAHEAHGDLVAVVFNGCIYNHRELRKELQAAGHVFESDHSDTEVLVHGWREWKEELVERLEGMYSFAIWDPVHCTADRWSTRFVLARDPVGEKPLYHTPRLRHSTDGIATSVFSSNWGAVRRIAMLAGHFGDHEFTPSRKLLTHWLRFGYAESPVRAIAQVAPPYQRNSTVRELRHVDTQNSTPLNPDAVDGLLKAAVATRVEADVPIGVFLSGGVDSSLVAKHAHDVLGRAITLSVTMPDSRYDESVHAAAVASKLGTDHHAVRVAEHPAEDIRWLIEQIGLPLGDSSLLPTHWVSKAARKHVTVALGGDGADELFAGYERYRAVDFLARHHRWLAAIRPQLLNAADPRSRSTKAARLAAVARTRDFFDLGAVFPQADITALIGPRAKRRWIWPISGGYLRRADLTNYLPDDLLRKVDSASMAVGLEVRSPFLDRSLVRAAVRTPYSELLLNGQRKGLLRAVARKYFPPEIVDRSKQGFAIPIGEWFRSDYGQLRQLLLDHLLGPEPFGPDSLGINAMINMNYVKQMLKEHDDAGEKSLWPWKGRDHSQRLYMLLVLSIWAKWLAKL